MAGGIKVLIVDDSPVICEMLVGIFSESSMFQVVAIANDPYEARDLIKSTNPDVITLDIEMPRMDGLTFLRNLMRLRPMPVVMISSLTQRGSRATLEALEIGAFDFVGKPNGSSEGDVRLVADVIRNKVRAAARSNIGQKRSYAPKIQPHLACSSAGVIGLGASTGGTIALKHVLAELPGDSPPVVVVQHLPLAFSAAFAARLNEVSGMQVALAEDGQVLRQGHVYIAPGDQHMRLTGRGQYLKVRLDKTQKVHLHRPAVDPLFISIAECTKGDSVAALMTGMGVDGAKGMVAVRQAGGHTIAQDEASSVVWGMPGEAVKLDGASEVLPLRKITSGIVAAVRKKARAS